MSKDRFKISTATEWSGNFNGIDNIIRTKKTARELTILSIDFIYDVSKLTDSIDCLYGALDLSENQHFAGYINSYTFRLSIGSEQWCHNLSSYMIDGNAYALHLIKWPATNEFQVILINQTLGDVEVYNSLKAIVGVLPDVELTISGLNKDYVGEPYESPLTISDFWVDLDHYSFQYYGDGVLFSDLGTELFVEGDIDNFLISNGLEFVPTTRFFVRPDNDATKVLIHISPISFVKDAVLVENYPKYKITVNDITLEQWKEIFDPITQTKVNYTPLFNSDPLTSFEAFVKVCEHRYIDDLYCTDQIYLEIVKDKYKN